MRPGATSKTGTGSASRYVGNNLYVTLYKLYCGFRTCTKELNTSGSNGEVSGNLAITQEVFLVHVPL